MRQKDYCSAEHGAACIVVQPPNYIEGVGCKGSYTFYKCIYPLQKCHETKVTSTVRGYD